jgi:hypothetical protein
MHCHHACITLTRVLLWHLHLLQIGLMMTTVMRSRASAGSRLRAGSSGSSSRPQPAKRPAAAATAELLAVLQAGQQQQQVLQVTTMKMMMQGCRCCLARLQALVRQLVVVAATAGCSGKLQQQQTKEMMT